MQWKTLQYMIILQKMQLFCLNDQAIVQQYELDVIKICKKYAILWERKLKEDYDDKR